MDCSVMADTAAQRRGFTLIELLVVIAIIGVLSGVVLASLNAARGKARDARRLSDMKEIRTALELYALNNGGRYPVGCRGANQWSGHGSSFGNCNTNYITGLAPTYIPVLPIDPSGDGSQGYIYRSDRNDYKLMAHRTVESGVVPKGEPNARCPASCSQSYCNNQRTYAMYTPTHACY